jgi:gliding motility-associated-like protein
VLPVADFISPGLECEGEFASVENASLYGETYEWYFEGGIPPYSDEQFPDSILYLLPGTYEIKLVVRNIFGADSLTRTITINQLPEVFLGADTSMSPGQILVLDAGTLMDMYLWQDGSNGQTYNVTESGEYRVIVSKDGCYATDTILVSFDDCIASLFVPNCFTPNQDGYNDTFMPVSQNLDEFNMLIFNRWGELLYETDNPENGWNGKVNGKICPIGTYFYLVKYTTECSSGMEKDGTLKGSVTLLE